jgi:hypothetical protein
VGLIENYPSEFSDRLRYLANARAQGIRLSSKEERMLRILNDVSVIRTAQGLLKKLRTAPGGDIEPFWNFIDAAADLPDQHPEGARLFIPGKTCEFYTGAEVVEIREELRRRASELRDELQKHADIHHFPDAQALDDLLEQFLASPAIAAPRTKVPTTPDPARMAGANDWHNYILERLFIRARAHLGERHPAFVTAVHRALLELADPVALNKANNYSAKHNKLVIYHLHAGFGHQYQPVQWRRK